MADPSPDDVADGQKPTDDEGQKPDAGDGKSGDAQETTPARTYPEAYVRQLRREAAATRTRLQEVEEKLAEHEERDKTESERLTEKAAKAERQASDAEAKLLRYEIASERGLDLAAAAFLSGTTREEIELRADELAKLLEDKGQKPAVTFDGGARQPVPEKGPPEQEHNDFLLRALGRQPSS
jgi:hypothetical protein